MKKILFTISILLINSAFTQQDEQSSLYMFNPLQYNSAYAGSRGCLNIVLEGVNQWVGIKGAPKSQFLSINTPISNKNFSLGSHISKDEIGTYKRTSFNGDYSYTLNFKHSRKLNLGVSAGGDQITIDNSNLIAHDPTDYKYLSTFSKLKGNIGVGMYYYAEHFYVGLSVPRIFQSALIKNSTPSFQTFSERHYFFSAGYVSHLSSILDLKTSVLIKTTSNSPITTDINTCLFYNKKVWGGLSYRLNESIGVILAFQINESIMFGYSFSTIVNGLNKINNQGSHEIMLNISQNKKKAFGSPRYF